MDKIKYYSDLFFKIVVILLAFGIPISMLCITIVTLWLFSIVRIPFYFLSDYDTFISYFAEKIISDTTEKTKDLWNTFFD